MNVRQFGIKNADSGDNEMLDLMSPNHFFNAPSGLGFETNVDTLLIGQTFIVTDEKPGQPSPSGEMYFSSYEEYDNFAKYVNIGGCVLCYKPSEAIPWRYLEVVVNMDKSEIDHETGYLICDIDFVGTSRWYEAVNISDTEGEISEDAKTYKYRSAATPDGEHYAYEYGYNASATEQFSKEHEGKYYYRYSSEYSGTISLENGSKPSYFKLTIYGPCTNPTWSLYEDSVITKTGRIFTTITDAQKLVVDTHPATMEISRYSLNGTFMEDLYGSSDFTTERIFEIPRGDSYITISAQDGSPRAWIEVKKIVSP